jgi:hypothetical protein
MLLFLLIKFQITLFLYEVYLFLWFRVYFYWLLLGSNYLQAVHSKNWSRCFSLPVDCSQPFGECFLKKNHTYSHLDIQNQWFCVWLLGLLALASLIYDLIFWWICEERQLHVNGKDTLERISWTGDSLTLNVSIFRLR